MLDRVMLAPQPPPAADALFEALKSPQLLTSPRPSGNGAMPWDGGTFTVLTAAGQTEKVALLRTPYGDVAGKFVDALSRLGAAHIAVLGTAGGLAPRSEIGQLVIPTAVNDDRGQRHAFANAVAPFLNDGAADRIRENAVTASLSTPLKESLAEIARLRDAGNDAVELELASMVETRLAKAPKLSVVLVVSDVPGSEETIESQAPNALDESVGEALDGVLDSMGVTELLIGRNTAAHSLVFTPRTAAAVVERVEELAAKAGIPLLDRPGFVGREVARLDDATIEQLSLPDDVILEHGKNLGDTLIGLFALARPWEVPGTEGQQRQPEKYLTAEATGFDAFALALDEQRRKYQR